MHADLQRSARFIMWACVLFPCRWSLVGSIISTLVTPRRPETFFLTCRRRDLRKGGTIRRFMCAIHAFKHGRSGCRGEGDLQPNLAGDLDTPIPHRFQVVRRWRGATCQQRWATFTYYMKFLLMAVFIGCWTSCKAAPAKGEGRRLFVYQTDGDRSCGGTNVWWLSPRQAAQLPKWHPGRSAQPPLSLKKALKSAKKWIDSKGGGEIEEVVLRPVQHSDSSPYRQLFYYRIRFGVAPYLNHLTCIILMDGTVLEPECHEYESQ